MTIHFVPTIDHLPRKVSENVDGNSKNCIGYLYMFEYKPRPNSDTIYVKIGRTENLILLTRLQSYPRDSDTFGEPIVPVNIFWSRVTQNLARKTLFKALVNRHPEVEIYHRDEYLLGKEESIRNLFSYSCSIDDKKIPSIMKDPTRYLYPHIEEDLFSVYNNRMVSYTEVNNSFNKNEWLTMWNNLANKDLFICEYCKRDCTNSQELTSHLKKCQSEQSLLIEECNRYKEKIDIQSGEIQSLRSEIEQLKNQDSQEISFSQINILLEERKVLKRQIELLEELLQYTRDKLNHK